MKRSLAWMPALFAAAAPAASAPAQTTPQPFLKQQEDIERFIWAEQEKDRSAATDVFLDYGGWHSFYLFLFDDGINSSRTLRRNDLRLWTRMSLDQGAHEIYARMRLSHLDFNTGDSYDGNDNDWEGPNLERGYYRFDLRKALSAYAKERVPWGFGFKIGRDLTGFGTGYVLSENLDQILLDGQFGKLDVSGLIAKSVGSSQDIDTSLPATRTRRALLGVQAKYRGIENHEPFVYALWNRDHNREHVPANLWTDLFQRHDYDSLYIGLGSTGQFRPDLRYFTEWVYESGRSYGHGRFSQRDVIRAWAWDAGITYLPTKRCSPRFDFEYMFAGGDPGRLLSPTNAVGGNRFDRTDTSFAGFGYRDTGLSFAPELSNVHIWKAGASFFPFEDKGFLDRLQLGTNWFLYHKNRRGGAVSDPTADLGSGYLGWEMDYYANWQIVSDLSFTVRYGVFFPGAAYSDRTTRTFFLTGLTWSF